MLTDDYRVHLDAFEGPLDLLLFLIRKNEVDVTDIPVGVIAEQYLGFLKQIDRIDIEAAGDFLVMAATLMEIKSRMLALAGQPERALAETSSSEGGEDPRSELVRQLLAYKAYRDAAGFLERRAADWQRRFPASAASSPASPGLVTPSSREGQDLDEALEAAGVSPEELELDLDSGEVDLLDIVEAFRKVFETVNFERLGEHQVKYDDTPIELHREDILAQLRAQITEHEAAGSEAGGIARRPSLQFTSLFQGRGRGEMIGLFLALLDLVRRSEVTVRQDKADGHIILELREDLDHIPAL